MPLFPRTMSRPLPVEAGYVRRTTGADAGCALYLLDLDAAPEASSLLVRLTEAERERAGRLATPALRARFAARRWGLRVALGTELGLAPEAVPLEWEAGRPRVRGEALCLSASSAGGVGVVAVAAVPVGVDVVERSWAREAVAATAGLPLAADAQRAAPSMDAELLALTVWTQFEAVLKAAGLELRFPEATRSVRAEDWSPEGTATLRVSGINAQWLGTPLAVPATHAGSLVIRAPAKLPA